MKTSVNRNLLIGFGLSILILILTSIASLISISNLLDSAKKVSHSNEVATQVDAILVTMIDAETGQRGFLLTNEEVFLEPYNRSANTIKARLQKIDELVKDNPVQLKNAAYIQEMAMRRFSILTKLIEDKKANNPINIMSLRNGKAFMDSIRDYVQVMKSTEQSLLKQQTESMNKFAAATPLFIAAAALISLLITIIFYIKIRKDILEKIALQYALEQKDIIINRRIDGIENLSNKIADGNFSIRVQESEKDNLGKLANSLNKMAASLEHSFHKLSNDEWLQSGIAQGGEIMMGASNLPIFIQKILNFIAFRTGSLVGAFYLLDNQNTLLFQDGFALDVQKVQQKISLGEGLVGQCGLNKQLHLIKDTGIAKMSVNFASVQLQPANIILLPIVFEQELKAVIELGSLQEYDDKTLQFFKNIAVTIGISINTIQNRISLQNLLEETQTQSEELLTQHNEMEQLNVELEAQWQQLQSSEEELKVQQEELMETNSALEERSVLLENRNVIVQEKNNEIQQKVEELALSTKYKSEFLANMSHELRTPLNSILLLSQLMEENQDKNLSAEQVKYAKVIRSSGKGLLQLIDEILDLSKIEAGKMTLDLSMVEIKNVTEDLRHLFEPVANPKNIEWKILIDNKVPQKIESDQLRLDQILKNLLSNAFKFTQQGHVHLVIDTDGNNINFTVKDSGSGIAADKQKMVFEAFKQADGSTRRKYGGTGLGLSISRELARLLGGEIILTSTPGVGSAFCLQLPLHKTTDKKPVPTVSAITTDKATVPVGITLPSLEESSQIYTTELIPEEIEDDRLSIVTGDKVLLIIEDDTSFAKALLDYTRQKGYKGIVAVQGDKGLEMAAKYPLAGILLDIQLPVKNGWQVIDELKKDPLTSTIPVHIMSSFQVKRESLVKGAINFINKPVAFEELNTVFDKLEYVLAKKDKKVLIVEDNYKHAKALAYYLQTYNVQVEVSSTVAESIASLQKQLVDCVILDMGIPNTSDYEMLEAIKENAALSDVPIILFTGKSLSQPETIKIKKYADTIVLKTAHSYQRILDEVSLFLHMVEDKKGNNKNNNPINNLVLDNVLKDKTVLLADDDVRNIFALTKALEKHHMNILPAMDGNEALQLLSKEGVMVDIILMDMMMPEMDGYETIKTIRSNTISKHIPIIAVTAKAMAGDREKCIAAGASDYISKPVDIDQLVSLLRIWLYEKSY